MATLRNNKVTGLITNEIANNNNAVTKTYADGVLPSPSGKGGSVLSKAAAGSSIWYYSETPQSTSNNRRNRFGWATDDLIVSMGYYHNDITASTDTIHWSIRTFPGNSSCGTSWGDGGWVDNGSDGLWYRVDRTVLAFSTDSIHWTLRTSGRNNGGFEVGYSEDSIAPLLHYKSPYYFTTNWSNELWASTDTIAWEQRTAPSGTFYSAGCALGQAIIGTTNNGIHTTTDWYHWKSRTTSVCGDVVNIQKVGDYVFASGSNTCTSGGAPYPVSVSLSTDIIHWTCCLTGYTTCCSSDQYHPKTVAYYSGRYYTAFQKADGSSNCCRGFYISSTDTVHWETSMDACSSGQTCTGSYFESNVQRVISNSDFILVATCGNGNQNNGWLVKPPDPAGKQWNCFVEGSELTSRRGSFTLDRNNCPNFNYTFPKDTQYVSMEIQGTGSSAGYCFGYSSTHSQYGGRGGTYYHIVVNKCDITNDDDFQLSVRGDTKGSYEANTNWGGLDISHDSDLSTFHKNMHSFTCGCCCNLHTAFSGLDASGNEIMIAASSSSYPLWTSIDGGVTWKKRTGGGSCCINNGLYVDGCPGHFRAVIYNKILHSTDSIHWSCSCVNQHGNCCIVHLSYQNSAYWAAGCKHLSCSPDGTTWYHRTVGQGTINCSFAYDSSGGYLISGMENNYLSASTDSIHWTKRTNTQCCIAGFRYFNSKWYSFGTMSGAYGPDKSWLIHSSTDTIHWIPDGGLSINGDCYSDQTAKVTRCAFGPNNETVITFMEPSNEDYLPFEGSYYNATESMKSTTDFIHWKDLSKNLSGYRVRQLGCSQACCNQIKDLKYSSDTKRFMVASVGTACLACDSNGPYSPGPTYDNIIFKYTLDGSQTCCFCHYMFSQPVQYCGFCCESCPSPYYMCQACSGFNSMRYLQKMRMGGDGPRAGLACPGVQCAYCSQFDRSTDNFDIGVSGASSGGSSGKSKGGGVCSSLGDIADTEIDLSELKQYEITVSASGSSNYTLTGEDRGGTFSGISNKSLTIKSGDLIAFTLDNTVSGHPFWIKLENSTGKSDRILAKFVTNNGSDSGEVVLDTYNLKPGTYHYNCEYHSGMHGTITVEDAVVSLDGENGIGFNYSLFGTGGAAGYTYKSGFGVWTQRTTPASSRDGCACCLSKVYYGCNNWIHTTECSIESSTDSIHWFLRTTGLCVNATKQLCMPTVAYGLCGSSPQWFLASQNARDGVTSTDTIHWTLRTLGLNDNSNLKAAYGNGYFVLKQCYHHTASTDGIHWKLRTTGTNDLKNNYYGAETLQYGDGFWVSSGNTYNAPLAASTDTIHWALRTTGLYGWYLYTATHAGNIWHINGESCTSISTDTIHWKNRACSGSASPSQCSPMVLYDGKYILGSRYSCITSINCDTTGLTDYSAYIQWQHENKALSQATTYINGLAVDDAARPQLIASDGIGVWAMDKGRSRNFGGNGGDGCNGGGAGAGASVFNNNNAWSLSGFSGRPGAKRIRITWW